MTASIATDFRIYGFGIPSDSSMLYTYMKCHDQGSPSSPPTLNAHSRGKVKKAGSQQDRAIARDRQHYHRLENLQGGVG